MNEEPAIRVVSSLGRHEATKQIDSRARDSRATRRYAKLPMHRRRNPRIYRILQQLDHSISRGLRRFLKRGGRFFFRDAFFDEGAER